MNAQDYRRAAAEARKRGKAVGCYESTHGRVCTIGAMGAAMMPEDVLQGVIDRVSEDDLVRVADLIGLVRVADLIGRRSKVPDVRRAIIGWSDRQDTSIEDIATLLEQVAEKLEADA